MFATSVQELTAAIEGQYKVGASSNCSRAWTGESYVTVGEQISGIRSDGLVNEGEKQEWGFDEETACLMAANCFERYAESRSGTLYWRVRPILEWNEDRSHCRVYIRCLISALPATALPCAGCTCKTGARR